jgi:hypothetical protein
VKLLSSLRAALVALALFPALGFAQQPILTGNQPLLAGTQVVVLTAASVTPTFLIRQDGVAQTINSILVPAYTTWANAVTAGADVPSGAQVFAYGQFQANTVGGTQTFGSGAATSLINLTKDYSNGTTGKFLLVDFRQGDQIRLTTANGYTIRCNGGSYFKINFDNSGTGWTKIGDSDLTWTAAAPLLSVASQQKSLYFTSCNNFRLHGTADTHNIFYGGNNGGYYPFWIDGASHDYYVNGTYHYLNGTNDNGAGGVSSDGALYEGLNALLVNIQTNIGGGHDSLQVDLANSIVDASTFGSYWTNAPQSTGSPGSRVSSFNPNWRSSGAGGTTNSGAPYGPLLIQNSNWNDAGSWAASEVVNVTKFQGQNLIARGNFMADGNAASHGSQAITIQVFCSNDTSTQTTSNLHIYNNTAYNTEGFVRVYDILDVGHTSCGSNAIINTDLEHEVVMNNLTYQQTSATAGTAFSAWILWQVNSEPLPLNSSHGGTWRNGFKGGRIEGNLAHFAASQPATASEIILYDSLGGGTASLDTPLAGWSSSDPGSGTPNVTNNTIVTAGAGTHRLDLVSAGSAPGRSRAGVYPSAATSNIGIGDRPPLTLVTVAAGGTTITVNDAGFFIAGLVTNSFIPEFATYNDDIWIGTTAATAVHYKLSAVNYATNVLTATTTIPSSAVAKGVWWGNATQPYADVGAIQQ